jgi:hypothetical protein
MLQHPLITPPVVLLQYDTYSNKLAVHSVHWLTMCAGCALEQVAACDYVRQLNALTLLQVQQQRAVSHLHT